MALPLIPGLGVLGLAGVRFWAGLHPVALQVFGWFALTQQVAALLTPDPLLASFLAAARSALLLGLLSLGSRLGSGRALWPVLFGGVGVGLTALVTSEQFRLGGLLSARLAHPYLTEVSLGILGTLGVLLSLFTPMKWIWKVLGVLGFAGLLLLSGSRGPLLMLGAGLAAGLLLSLTTRRARLTALAVGAALMVLGVAVLGQGQGPEFMARLLTLDSTGRDLVWLNTLTTIQNFPLGGVGPYLLGSTLADPVQTCTLWPTLAEAGYSCPAWLSALGQPWLIAHNGILQQLGESGVIGTAGLLLLWGTVLAATVRRRDPAAAALIAAILIGSLLDNTTLLPSPFFAEVFWLTAGMVLSREGRVTSDSFVPGSLTWRPLLWGTSVLGIMGFPLLAALRVPSETPVRLVTLNADTLVVPNSPYRVYVRLEGAQGPYRLALRTCRTFCQTVAVQAFEVSQGRAEVWLEGQLVPSAQRMNLLLLPGTAAPWSLRPLAAVQWSVRRVP
ncbi:O-antigen ligase family protein [Deinococcus budaensis]|uniref:O-antigen ligase n=1 Tax=Deinococcus budaensis TaxID=1665626 RepID=A0A7W8GGN3_9DEIO|nr:O-antigen ligase family protein [Deinococcus budaensis]MBB5234811.1 O-antigen ligase [Deinococcus budaensis]